MVKTVQRAVYPYIPTSNRNSMMSSTLTAEAVYPYIPTSNRNHHGHWNSALVLYILIFLHQTATVMPALCNTSCCISLYSYIKPQQPAVGTPTAKGCISLYSYIKPQLWRYRPYRDYAVYPYIPTSNRNHHVLKRTLLWLYILIFLHQTTTPCPSKTRGRWLYILIFLHQTATLPRRPCRSCCCISLYSYIKPQPINCFIIFS